MSPTAMNLVSLSQLHQSLSEGSDELSAVIAMAGAQNSWFTPEFVREALQAVINSCFDPAKVEKWLAGYHAPVMQEKRIGLVLAGNIPMVGFNDLFCVFASGHHAIVKLSDKDKVLIPALVSLWGRYDPAVLKKIEFVERLEGIDAVVATGSNNSLRYFNYYFRNIPHVFRPNRNGVAIITGKESDATLRELMKDIFLYFGLGCRNVAKIWVPSGYDFSTWEACVAPWAYLADHHNYRNNLDYNHAIYLVNQVQHIQLGPLILKQDEEIASRIGCLHFTYYQAITEVETALQQHRDQIQCVVSSIPIDGWDVVFPGQSQYPALTDYADGIDTMQFLTTL